MSHFDINNKEQKLKELENKTLEPNFWNDAKNSTQVLSEIKKIKGTSKFRTRRRNCKRYIKKYQKNCD